MSTTQSRHAAACFLSFEQWQCGLCRRFFIHILNSGLEKISFKWILISILCIYTLKSGIWRRKIRIEGQCCDSAAMVWWPSNIQSCFFCNRSMQNSGIYCLINCLRSTNYEWMRWKNMQECLKENWMLSSSVEEYVKWYRGIEWWWTSTRVVVPLSNLF